MAVLLFIHCGTALPPLVTSTLVAALWVAQVGVSGQQSKASGFKLSAWQSRFADSCVQVGPYGNRFLASACLCFLPLDWVAASCDCCVLWRHPGRLCAQYASPSLT